MSGAEASSSGFRWSGIWLLLLGAGLIVAGLIAWRLATELLLLFAATLFAVALSRGAAALARNTRLTHGWALIAWLIGITLLLSGFVWFAGARFSDQLDILTERIPTALDQAGDWVTTQPILRPLTAEIDSLIEGMSNDSQAMGSRLLDAFRVTTSTLLLLVAWVVLVLFLAIDLERYRGMFIRVVPPRHRNAARDLLDHLGPALTWWLLGRIISMSIVGVLTILGLLILDVPLAFALGLIAGLFSFVPFLGPIAATVPAVLVGISESPNTALWVLGLFGLVQFLESYVITPQVQSRMVSVPPVLLIMCQLMLGTLLGIGGVMFATPLAVAAVVTLQVLYLRHGLGERVRVWGEH